MNILLKTSLHYITTDRITIDAFYKIRQNKTMCHRAIASKGGGPEPRRSLFLPCTVKRKLCSVWIQQIESTNPL